MRGRNTRQQQEAVAGVLSSLLPPQAPANFRKWFPFNKVGRERLAAGALPMHTALLSKGRMRPAVPRCALLCSDCP
jgi:hypothetical protein